MKHYPRLEVIDDVHRCGLGKYQRFQRSHFTADLENPGRRRDDLSAVKVEGRSCLGVDCKMQEMKRRCVRERPHSESVVVPENVNHVGAGRNLPVKAANHCFGSSF